MSRRKEETQQSEEDEDEESQDGEKIQIRKPKIERIDKFKNLKKIVINVSMTQYPVVTEVSEDLGWKIQTSNDAGDWDVYWTDFSIDPDILIKMHLFQKINHFPGIHVIARKNLLGQNLTNMSKKFPNEYNFFPMTWLLPQQYAQFREYYESKQKGKTRTYIVKPEADCQGRGIFLTRKIEDMETGKHYVVQRYMARPFLLDGLKFDMRIYVLMCGTDPLKLYLYNEGLARLATEPYQQPMNANLDRLCMHLTNYAINKFNPNFIFNNNVNNMGIGHKRALSCVMKQLGQRGVDVEVLKQKIKDIIIKTIISGLPLISHQYKFSQPEDYSGNMCFHLLGLDVMINNKAEPFVIEVNHTPSFTTDTPLDHKIKFNLIKDTLVLMNVNVKQKNQLFNRCKEYNTERLLTGKRHIYEGEDRQAKIKEAQEEREKYQRQNLGGFEKIFPLDDPIQNQKYQQMIGAAMKMYMEENQAVRARYEEKQIKKLIRSELKKMRSNPKDPQFLQKNQSANQNKSAIQIREKSGQSEILKAAPREQNLSLSQPVPIIENDTSQKRQADGDALDQRQALDNSRLNQIRKRNVRDSSYTAERKEKSEKIIQEGKFFNQNKLRASSKRSTPTDLKRINPNELTQKQLPAVTSGGIIDFIQGIQSQNRKKKHEKVLQNRVALKSQPKPIKLLQSIERQMRMNYDKKLQNNGGFVMPKIFSINVDPQKQEKEKEKDQLNFLSLGRKAQSTLYPNNNG